MLVSRGNNVLAPARWAGDFGGREHVLPMPLKVDPSQFVDGAGVQVSLTSQVSPGTNEIQTITIDATGGTFKITFNGQQTGAIAYNASADAVRDALEALSSGGVGNFKVTLATLVYTVTFQNGLGHQNVPAMTTDATSLTGGGSTAVVATTTPGAAGDTTMAVTALTLTGAVVPLVTSTQALIPAGSVIQFGAGQYVTTTAPAYPGDVSVAIQAATVLIPNLSVATFSKYGTKALLSGTLIGRTNTERLANTPFGPAAIDGSDDEVYIVVFDNYDLNLNADVEAYRHNGIVYENYLPQWVALQTGPYTGLLAQIRSSYSCMQGQD